jgi:hypothetical protein
VTRSITLSAGDVEWHYLAANGHAKRPRNQRARAACSEAATSALEDECEAFARAVGSNCARNGKSRQDRVAVALWSCADRGSSSQRSVIAAANRFRDNT